MLLLSFNVVFALNLNKTTILVDDSDANDPIKFQQAFAQIIANNSGASLRTVLSSVDLTVESIKQGVRRSYLEKVESRYLRDTNQAKFWFHLVMSEKFIRNTIQQSGLSLMPNNRETIMVWAVKEQQEDGAQTTRFVKENDTSAYWIKRWGQSFALNLTWPSLDNKDLAKVSTSHVKSMRNNAVKQSKNRYGHDFSLLMFIRESNQAIKIRTGFSANSSDLSIKYFQETGAEEGELMFSVLENAAKRYAAIHKVEASSLENHTVQIVIKGIDNYDESRRVSEFFSQLSVINKQQIVAAQPGKMVITVDLTVSTQAFLEIVSRQGLLSYDENASVNQLVFTSIQ